MLPFLVIISSLALLPGQLNSNAPVATSLFSVPAATFVHSLSKSSHNVTTQSYPRRHQPNQFPLFPHPVNMEHTATPRNPFSSIVYFTLPVTPGGDVHAPRSPLPSHSTPPLTRARNIPTAPLNGALAGSLATTHSQALVPKLSCLDATLTERPGAPTRAPTLSRAVPNPQSRYLFTSLRLCLNFATLSFRGAL
jgi:hypothetical protein